MALLNTPMYYLHTYSPQWFWPPSDGIPKSRKVEKKSTIPRTENRGWNSTCFFFNYSNELLHKHILLSMALMLKMEQLGYIVSKDIKYCIQHKNKRHAIDRQCNGACKSKETKRNETKKRIYND